VRRKRFQRGCLRKTKHGRLWVWIGKYYEDGRGRSKVLGHCAQMTEGAAWARLQEYLTRSTRPPDSGRRCRPISENTSQMCSCLKRRKNGRTPQTKLLQNVSKRIWLPAFEWPPIARPDARAVAAVPRRQDHGWSFEERVSHLRWDLNAVFKMAADDGLIQGNPAGSLVTPKEAKTFREAQYDQGGNPFGVICVGSPGTDRLLVRRSGRNAPWGDLRAPMGTSWAGHGQHLGTGLPQAAERSKTQRGKRVAAGTARFGR